MRSIDGEVESSSGSRSGCPSYNLSVTFGDSSPSRGASGGAEKFPMEDEALRNASASPFGRGVTEGDGEGKPGIKEFPHSDKQALCQSNTIAAPAIFRRHPCPLRRFAPALPKGEPERGYGVRRLGPRNRNSASLMDWPQSSMVRRSMPRPKPPCGGQPYWKNSR